MVKWLIVAEKINENFEDLKDVISRLNELLAQLLPQFFNITLA